MSSFGIVLQKGFLQGKQKNKAPGADAPGPFEQTFEINTRQSQKWKSSSHSHFPPDPSVAR